MCRLFATKLRSQDWRSSIDEGSVVPPKDTSAPLYHTISIHITLRRGVCRGLRRKEPPLAGQNRDEDFLVLSDFVHGSRKFVVRVSAHGIEFLGDIECDDGDFAAVLDEDGFFFLGHLYYLDFGRTECCYGSFLLVWSWISSADQADQADPTAVGVSSRTLEPRSDIALGLRGPWWSAT
jgi:hypothetical protein